ncbi:MAG TPA: hypothetical protein PLK12_16605 [Prolixibacteraceae bacterium]|nr:hypothetical protein [Prolixibacteraceae bacterium]
MKKKEEKLIQRKTEGTLRPNEETAFRKLIDRSAEAKKYHQFLSTVDKALKNDSDDITSPDVSESVMKEIGARENPKMKMQNKPLFFHYITPWNVLTYAAILVFGLFIGGFVTYVSSVSPSSTETRNMAGTMGKKDHDQSAYQEEGITIYIQKMKTDSWKMALVELETSKALECRITNHSEPFSAEKLMFLSENPPYSFLPEKESDLAFSCSGKQSFLVPAPAGSVLEIRFYSGDRFLKQFTLK